MLLLKLRPFVQSSLSICSLFDSHTCFVFFFLFFYLDMSLFPSIFPLSLCIESTSYVLSFPDGVFLPCDHGLDF